MASPLILFDIDGTLLRRAGPHHREALVAAIRRVTGLNTTTDGIPVPGMLDRDIIAAMLRTAGVREGQIRKAMPPIVVAAQRIYAKTCPDLRRRVCPGTRRLLCGLTRLGIPTGLVTGNLSGIGWKKMERAGLRHFFHFGAFAEAAADRAGLVRLAVRLATARGWIGRDSPVALIGDHPNDIEAARANGIGAIAVATGMIPAGELAKWHPYLVVADMRQLTPEIVLRAARVCAPKGCSPATRLP